MDILKRNDCLTFLPVEHTQTHFEQEVEFMIVYLQNAKSNA